MFCRKCGAQMCDDSLFCSVCGEKVIVPAMQQSAQPQAQQPIIYSKSKRPGRGFGITSMVLGIIGLVYAYSFLMMAFSFAQTHIFPEDIDNAHGFLSMLLIFSSLPIMAIIFGITAGKRGYQCKITKSGLIMGCIGLGGYFLSLLIFIAAFFVFS